MGEKEKIKKMGKDGEMENRGKNRKERKKIKKI